MLIKANGVQFRALQVEKHTETLQTCKVVSCIVHYDGDCYTIEHPTVINTAILTNPITGPMPDIVDEDPTIGGVDITAQGIRYWRKAIPLARIQLTTLMYAKPNFVHGPQYLDWLDYERGHCLDTGSSLPMYDPKEERFVIGEHMRLSCTVGDYVAFGMDDQPRFVVKHENLTRKYEIC